MKCLYFKIFIFFIISIIQLSCIEEYQLEVKDTEEQIVIQALLTDYPGPYFVRITKTLNKLKVPEIFSTEPYSDGAIPVLGATVIISDDNNNVDTLIPSPYIPDSSLGYYCTTHIKGISGRKYFIDVYIDNNHYHAESKMYPPISIDTILFVFKEGNAGKENYVIPYVKINSISINNSTQYLLFCGDISSVNLISYNLKVFSLIYTSRYKDIFPLYKSSSGNIEEYYPWHLFIDSISFTLYTIDKICFEFHKNVLSQLRNDGGAYKPSPATPKGNFSGGAIGIFQVSSVSNYKTIAIPRK